MIIFYKLWSVWADFRLKIVAGFAEALCLLHGEPTDLEVGAGREDSGSGLVGGAGDISQPRCRAVARAGKIGPFSKRCAISQSMISPGGPCPSSSGKWDTRADSLPAEPGRPLQIIALS